MINCIQRVTQLVLLTISFGKLLQRDRIVLGRGQLHGVLRLKVRHLVDSMRFFWFTWGPDSKSSET